MKYILQIIVFMVLFAPCLISAQTIDAPTTNASEKQLLPKNEDQKNTKPAKNQPTWQNKKFSIGFAVFNEISIFNRLPFLPPKNFLERDIINDRAVVGIISSNLRYWILPNLQVSLHAVQFINDPPIEINPATINIGYGNGHKNMYWYIETGVGSDVLSKTPVLILNISTGIEWLITEHYALGFNIRAGDMIYAENDHQFYASFAITTNLVF
jgi:hypothetical protein